jgi:hypothetical protein
MAGYDDWKTPTSGWIVTRSNDEFIAVGNELTFEGPGGSTPDPRNKITNVSSQTVWFSNFGYDSANDKTTKFTRATIPYEIRHTTRVSTTNRATLTCVKNPPSGGTSWTAQEGG